MRPCRAEWDRVARYSVVLVQPRPMYTDHTENSGSVLLPNAGLYPGVERILISVLSSVEACGGLSSGLGPPGSGTRR